jgi:hypothetical protein
MGHSSRMLRTSPFLLPATLALIFLAGCGSAEQGEPPADAAHGGSGRQDTSEPPGEQAPVSPADAIRQWQENRDESARSSDLSPFTAVEAYYVEEGVTARIGADDQGTRRDPDPPMDVMAAITYREGEIVVEAVPGAGGPFIHGVDEEGEPVSPGTEVKQPHTLGEEELVGMGSFFLSMSPQSGFGRIMVYDPASPMRDGFGGFEWFPPDPDLQVRATWKANPSHDDVTVGTSRGLEKDFHRAGTFEFEVEGQPQTLVALTASALPEPGDRLFMPFRDATTGKETYVIGRYLGVKFEGEGKEHVIDFNKATNPLCNYSPHYNCPLPPKENTLAVAIRAGEMTYPTH